MKKCVTYKLVFKINIFKKINSFFINAKQKKKNRKKISNYYGIIPILKNKIKMLL